MRARWNVDVGCMLLGTGQYSYVLFLLTVFIQKGHFSERLFPKSHSLISKSLEIRKSDHWSEVDFSKTSKDLRVGEMTIQNINPLEE